MRKTILIVDDSPTMIMSVRATLEMNGYAVDPPATAAAR
jgi:CheY-like chemotaxis protein